MVQRPFAQECAYLLISTHEAQECDIRAMMKELESLETVLEAPYMIRIV
jgi:hypothetical protein